MNLREDGPRNVERVQQLRVPFPCVDIETHGAGGVGKVRRVNLSVGETVEEIGVDGAEADVARFRPATESGYVFQEPDDFSGGKVGVYDKACLFANHFFKTPLPVASADVGRSAALPHNGVVDGFARAPIPQDGGFSLVGDPDTLKVGRAHACISDRIGDHGAGRTPDLLRVVRNPPGFRVDLAEFRIGAAGNVT